MGNSFPDFGPFETCNKKEIFGFGDYIDQTFLLPEPVIFSTILLLDPAIIYSIDQWCNQEVKGIPYKVPSEKVVFLMRDGGADIAPYHNLADKVPREVKDAVAKKKKEIMEGKFVVPFSEAQPKSD